MNKQESLPRVLVIVPTFNGEKYLSQQIESIRKQIGVNVRVYVRDDSSTDSTIKILENYSSDDFKIIRGLENIGTAKSLKILMSEVLQDEFLALADQDDVWDPNHLSEAVKALGNDQTPDFNLYFPRYKFIDGVGRNISSREKRKIVGLPNSLVENPAIGCGIVLNPAGALLCKEIELLSDLHIDKQLYFLASALGNVIQGEAETVFYRLHDKNQVGIGRQHDFIRMTSQLLRDQKGLEILFNRVKNHISPERTRLLNRHFQSINGYKPRRFLYAIFPSFRREKPLDQFLFQVLFALIQFR